MPTSASPSCSSSWSSCCSSSGPSACPAGPPAGRRHARVQGLDHRQGQGDDDDEDDATPPRRAPELTRAQPGRRADPSPSATRAPVRRSGTSPPRDRGGRRPYARHPARRPRGPAQPRRAPRRAAHPAHLCVVVASSWRSASATGRTTGSCDIVNKPLDNAHRVDGKRPQEGRRRARAVRLLRRGGRRVPDVGRAARSATPAAAADAAAPAPTACRRDARPGRGGRASAARHAPCGARRPRDAQASTGRQPVTLGVTEPFLTTFTVGAYAALLLALPFLLYQLYAFILPAFTREERRVALPLMLLVPVLFIARRRCSATSSRCRGPSTSCRTSTTARSTSSCRPRTTTVLRSLLLAAMGVLFQIPVGVLAIMRLRILTRQAAAQDTAATVILFAIVAAVVTPTPDPVTMLIAMAPLVVLFELSYPAGAALRADGRAARRLPATSG